MAGVFNQLRSQPQQPVVVNPMPQYIDQTLPNFPISPYVYNPIQGLGAARFLTGNVPIPMEFGVPQTEYRTYQFQPGPYKQFVEALDFSDPKNPVIPVYNPQTGMYEAVSSNKLRSSEQSADQILGSGSYAGASGGS